MLPMWNANSQEAGWPAEYFWSILFLISRTCSFLIHLTLPVIFWTESNIRVVTALGSSPSLIQFRILNNKSKLTKSLFPMLNKPGKIQHQMKLHIKKGNVNRHSNNRVCLLMAQQCLSGFVSTWTWIEATFYKDTLSLKSRWLYIKTFRTYLKQT